jgi:hypothetical protein
MSKPNSTDIAPLDLTTGQKILAGLKAGLLWSLVLSVLILAIVPIISPLMLLVLAIVTTLNISAGIWFNLRSARQPCPECGTVFTVLPTGSRCPHCGHRTKIQNISSNTENNREI